MKERILMHWGFGFLPLIPLFWIAVLFCLFWSLKRWSGWRNGRMSAWPAGTPPFEPSALEILRRRYARGEIDATTFDQMRERLEGSRGREDL
jgi:uncharacterized membrane protein